MGMAANASTDGGRRPRSRPMSFSLAGMLANGDCEPSPGAVPCGGCDQVLRFTPAPPSFTTTTPTSSRYPLGARTSSARSSAASLGVVADHRVHDVRRLGVPEEPVRPNNQYASKRTTPLEPRHSPSAGQPPLHVLMLGEVIHAAVVPQQPRL